MYRDTTSNGRIVLSIEPNDRGSANLVIDSVTFHGQDFLAGLAKLEGLAPENIVVQLFFTSLAQVNGSTTVESWRLRPGAESNGPEMEAALAGLDAFLNSCEGSEGLDPITYGGTGIDELLFEVDEVTGQATGIDSRVLSAGIWTEVVSWWMV